MRTTIEMKDSHRSRLLAIAAARHEKGFSAIVSDALEEYLARHAHKADARAKALALRGVLSAKETENLRKVTSEIRDSWR